MKCSDLITMLIKNNEIVVICGQPGHGKTFAAKVILSNFDRHIIFDSLNEYAFNGDPTQKKYCPFNLNRVVPTGRDSFEEFQTGVWTQGNSMVGIDEIDTLVEKNRELKDQGRMYDLTHLHFHRNIGMVVIARRTQNIHKDIMSCADHILAFRMFIKNDIEWLKDTIGDDALKTRDLPPRHFLHYSESGIEICPPLAAPRGAPNTSPSPEPTPSTDPESQGPPPTPE